MNKKIEKLEMKSADGAAEGVARLARVISILSRKIIVALCG